MQQAAGTLALPEQAPAAARRPSPVDITPTCGPQAQLDNTRYSRGLRQRLYGAAREQGWRERYGILVGE